MPKSSDDAVGPLLVVPWSGLGVLVRDVDRLGLGMHSSDRGLSGPHGSAFCMRDRFNNLVPRAAGKFDLEGK